MKQRVLIGALVSAVALGSVSRPAVAQSVAASPATATASPDATRASLRFRRGVELFREGDFHTALSEFRRAYEVQENYRVMYNIAQCFVNLREPASAMRAFTRYLRDGGDDIPEERRRQVEHELAELGTRVARVTIRSDVAGAEVFVDEERIGVTPLTGETIIGVGRHRVTASYAGRSQVKPLDIAAGDVVELAFEMGSLAESRAPVAPAVETRAETSRTPSSVVWLGWAGTGLLAAGAITTGIMAMNARSATDESLARFDVDAGRVASERSKMQALAVTSDILSITALVAGGVSLYVTLRRDAKGASHPAAASAAQGKVGWSW